MVQGFGIIYSELIYQFGTSKAETGWIPSLGSGLLLGFGPVSSILVKLIGCRGVAVMGALSISIGMSASMFVNDVHELYLTYGIIAGIGNGMVFHSAVVAVNSHFEKSRLALTILTIGSPASLLTTPFLTTIWIDTYGWRGTFLLLAGISLQGVVCGALFRPLENKSPAESDETPVKLASIKVELKAIFSISDFVLFCLYSSFGTLGYMVPYVLVPAMAAEKGVSSLDVPFITTAAGLLGIIARLVAGVIVAKGLVNTLLLHGTALLIGAIATAACAYFSSYQMFLIYGGILGMFTGIFGALLSVITVDIVGKSNLNMAFGTLSFFHGITFTLGTPIAGWIADVSEGYGNGLYFASAVFAIGSVISFCIYIRRRRNARSLKSLINQISIQKGLNLKVAHQIIGGWTVAHQIIGSRKVAHQINGGWTVAHQINGDWTVAHQINGGWTGAHQINGPWTVAHQINGRWTVAHQINGRWPVAQQINGLDSGTPD
ncbi:monocarboxylate transporter 4-like [Mizuhopecten yessoensis]|uniref:monocarboxylate transporter 4-like n=1 Tax=Mizuhopecten yessoensis TaxID=6573 RepID=UPI000B459F77|nr:monocarboxylate transporter 4-like [Mizuhopecten yessoensis]